MLAGVEMLRRAGFGRSSCELSPASLSEVNTMRPLVPEDLHHNGNASLRSLSRAAVVIGRGALEPADPRATERFVVRRGWDDDRIAGYLTRAAVAPATTTSTGWAKELATVSTAFLAAMIPASAGADLLSRALRVTFGQAASLTLPTMAPGVASFISESSAIPVEQFASAGPTMTPRKLAAIVQASSELLASENAETFLRTALIETAAAGLDAVLFDANAGNDIRPPGLRYGLSSLTPATGGGDAAMLNDAAALANAVTVGAGEDLVYVAARAQAHALRIRGTREFPYPVLLSPALASGTVIAVAAQGLAAALEAPLIDASRQAAVHRADPAAELVTAGGVVATPIMSTFQCDSAAIRLRQPVSWAVRATGAVAFVSSVTW
jgi:hypothetical protein